MKESILKQIYYNDEYRNDLLSRLAHHSSNIEGNTITLSETKSLIIDDLSPNKKSMREVYEVLNHKQCLYNILEKLLEEEKLDIYTIKSIHKDLLDKLEPTRGEFKKISNRIGGSKNETTPSEKVQVEMYKWYENLKYRLSLAINDEEKLKIILQSHIEFETIHPFQDGNGRTGRIIMLYLCFQENIIPFIITKEIKQEYIECLENDNINKFYEIVEELQKEELKYIKSFNIDLYKIKEEYHSKKLFIKYTDEDIEKNDKFLKEFEKFDNEINEMAKKYEIKIDGEIINKSLILNFEKENKSKSLKIKDFSNTLYEDNLKDFINMVKDEMKKQ